MICDSHIHFFSPGFFAGLGANRSAITALGWEFPESTEALSADGSPSSTGTASTRRR